MKQPVRVAVTGAAGQIGYALLFRIASGAMLGPDQPVILQLLEIPEEKAQNALKWVMMELEDCAFPLLAGMEAHSDPMQAFKDSDYALLVGARPRGRGMERADLLAEQGAVFIGVVPRLHFLALVVAFHAGGGLLQGRLNVCGQALESGLQIGLGKREVGHALCRSAVKAVAVFDHGRIAALLHIGADIGHDLIDFRVLRGFKSQQGLERALEVGRLGVEQFHVFLCGCSIR